MYTVGAQIQRKLNWVQHRLAEGLVADSGWLERHGYSRGLRKKYVASGWLEQVAHGVFRRPVAKTFGKSRTTPSWEDVVVSMQAVLELPFAVGGRTALELQGFAHYLTTSGPREVHLYSEGREPAWASRVKLDATLVFHNASKLFAAADGSLIRQPLSRYDWPLEMSSPERAILELLDEVPQRETFEQADALMEGLGNLSPRRLQKLLTECRSVKVKRLFFWFADRHNHAWLGKLDRSGIDLGRGKRMLARGGKLDAKYQITVPGNLDGNR
jgi:hypothetical protein